MLGVILNVMKHQSSVTGMELNIHVCLGPLLLLLVCPSPSPSPVHRFSSAAMILENKRVGLSRVAVHAITKNWEGGGGGGGAAPDMLFKNYQFKRQPLNVTQSELALNRTYRAYIYYAD